VGVWVCMSDKEIERERVRKREREREREREVQSFFSPWVYCSNIVILINIYLQGKVERMISLSVCVCVRVRVFWSARPFVLVCITYYSI